MTHHKNRNLSALEYLEVIIKEYLIADMRRRIYHKKSDKKYWEKVSKLKRNVIEDITTRNRIPSIFNDNKTREKYYDIYFPKNKLPIIIQNDEDLYYYFSKDADIIIERNGEIEFGHIELVDHENQNLTARMKETHEEETFDFSEVRRVL